MPFSSAQLNTHENFTIPTFPEQAHLAEFESGSALSAIEAGSDHPVERVGNGNESSQTMRHPLQDAYVILPPVYQRTPALDLPERIINRIAPPAYDPDASNPPVAQPPLAELPPYFQ
jgi:hypothetical protein